MKKELITCLWFDNQAEEAAEFYTSIFKDSKIENISRYGSEGKEIHGGEESQCGWLKDKFGLSWQVVPSVLSDLMQDPERAERVTRTFLKMKKMNIDKLLSA